MLQLINKKIFFKIVFSFLLCFIFIRSTAQINGGMPGGNRQAPPNLGHIYGKIVDASNKPVSNASVLLLQNKYDSLSKKRRDVLLKGINTKANGEFNFEDLPIFGTLKMQVTAIGFSNYESNISFQLKMDPSAMSKPSVNNNGEMPGTTMLSNFDKDLGVIKLTVSAQVLQGVTVTAVAPSLKLEADKKVFNVDKNLVSAGGTAQDVMKNVPSVLVDIDGNVTLRNATPQIYVDGKPTTLQLDQIPADAIQSVEIITNPSAKYDASGGGAGILNIVLKKNKKTGYNGNVRLGVDKRGGINSGADISLRQNKINVSASVMGMRMISKTSGTTDRYNFFAAPETQVYQANENKTKGGFIFGRLGFDWFATNKTTFSISGIKVHGSFKPTENISIQTDSLYSAGKIRSSSYRNSSSDNSIDVSGLQLGFKQLFTKQGREWTADVNYNEGQNKNNALYLTDYYNSTSVFTKQDQQKVIGSGNNKFFTAQTDFINPIGEKGKIEAGLRASIRDTKNDNSNYLYNAVTNTFVIIPSTTNNYKNTDKVFAAYGTYSNAVKNFSYQLGLRAESSQYDGTLTNTGQKFSNKYAVSLFPSVFLSQKLKGDQELQLNVSRRINRPTFFQLIPYTDYTDNLNITKGNPDLKPEFTYSAEISYLKTYQKNNSFLASIYYKNTNDLITRYQQKETSALDGKEVLVSSYINANSSYNYGVELTSQNYINKWWDGSLNVNLYNAKIDASNVSGADQNSRFSYFGKWNNNFKLPQNFTVQLSAVYQSKTNIPSTSGRSGGGMGGPGGGSQGGPFGQAQTSSQGYIKANYGFDLAIKKSFLKSNAASITLSVNDIFKTRKNEQYSYSDYFTQTYSRLRDPQMVKLNFNYRFGKIDATLFKRKNLKTQAEGMQNATEGVQY